MTSRQEKRLLVLSLHHGSCHFRASASSKPDCQRVHFRQHLGGDLFWQVDPDHFWIASKRSMRLGLGAELGYGRGPIGYADNVVIAQTSGPFASLSVESSLQL